LSTERSTVVARSPLDFMDELLVDCPRCTGAAIIRTAPPARPDNRNYDVESRARRMVCTACGAVREQPDTPLGQILTPFMGLTPRLRVETRHGTLVAFNAGHLAYIETWLAGRLRTELEDPRGWVRNRSVIARLPAWAKAARNRDEMLAAIARTRQSRSPS
jgi:hypothetical protein